MSTLTKNFKFIKPALTDAADITQTNPNWDILDEELNNMDIPVTSEVPEDSNIWIDPDDNTLEESHINNKNNPHNVTAEQVGAMTMELMWENASPSSTFAKQTVSLNLADFAGVFITYRNQTNGSVYNTTGFIGKGDGFTLIYVPSVSSSVAVTRKGTVDANGVNFLENSNESNNYHIPLKIYGVKGAIA